VHRRIGSLIALVAALATGCGGQSPRIVDGDLYGKVVAVNVADRKLTFAPVCRLSKSGRWIALPVSSRTRVTATISPQASLEVYYRPNGNAAEGNGQSVNLRQIAEVALDGHLPDFPPGWFVTVRDDAVVSVEEDSGVRSSGEADKRTFACVWSRSTQAFVGS
jgi:hypothetical protein